MILGFSLSPMYRPNLAWSSRYGLLPPSTFSLMKDVLYDFTVRSYVQIPAISLFDRPAAII